jgi:hypothetical protein
VARPRRTIANPAKYRGASEISEAAHDLAARFAEVDALIVSSLHQCNEVCCGLKNSD